MDRKTRCLLCWSKSNNATMIFCGCISRSCIIRPTWYKSVLPYFISVICITSIAFNVFKVACLFVLLIWECLKKAAKRFTLTVVLAKLSKKSEKFVKGSCVCWIIVRAKKAESGVNGFPDKYEYKANTWKRT